MCDLDLSGERNRRVCWKRANLHGHNYVLAVAVIGKADQPNVQVLNLRWGSRRALTAWKMRHEMALPVEGLRDTTRSGKR